jgi:hypothetical protein
MQLKLSTDRILAVQQNLTNNYKFELSRCRKSKTFSGKKIQLYIGGSCKHKSGIDGT